jgi:hypothetical protein
MNKEIITIIDDNNVMYVGEHHFSDDWIGATAKHYLLKNLVTVGYNVDADKNVSVSLLPVGVPEILTDKTKNFVHFATSKIKIESSSELSPEFLEKYNAIFSSDVK